MAERNNAKGAKLVQQMISTVLLLAAASLIAYLSVNHKYQADWTAGNRNSLTPASSRLLGSMHGPIHFVAFLASDSELKPEVQRWMERYQRVKPEIKVDYVDPTRHPEDAKKYNVQQPGEVIVEYQGRRETLHALSEPEVTGALERLAAGSESKIEFLTGHGERTTRPGAQGNISGLAQALQDKGLKTEELNLGATAKIPADTSVLVVADASNALLPGEDKLITDWVAAGGNLLWLQSYDVPVALPQLAQSLGVAFLNGYAALADWQALGTGNPALFLVTSYPVNDVTPKFDTFTLFPYIRPMTVKAPDAWQAKPLLMSDADAWAESDPKQEPAQFDKGDVKGPLTLGMTFSRQVKAEAAPAPASSAGKAPAMRQQRVVVIGNADFLSDQFLRLAGNRAFAVDVFQWLALRDGQLNIDVPKAPDNMLFMPRWLMLLIGLGFALALPALLIGFGTMRWAMRRRR